MTQGRLHYDLDRDPHTKNSQFGRIILLKTTFFKIFFFNIYIFVEM